MVQILKMVEILKLNPSKAEKDAFKSLYYDVICHGCRSELRFKGDEVVYDDDDAIALRCPICRATNWVLKSRGVVRA
jgi:hypothetical protein